MLLQTFYSNRFTSTLNSEELYIAALRVWDNALKDVSNDTIKKVLDSLPSKYPSWPPTPGEFYELCVAINGSTRFKFKSDADLLPSEKTSHKPSNEVIDRLINEGAEVCKILKEIYPCDSYMDTAVRFTKLKKISRSYYPGLSDIELFKNLMKMTNDEIKETLLDSFINQKE